ncbi:hypothetical protein BJV74DRAFT_860011 [Russula compacta]|nr:hypothetical protein BJV74DRAFT_860011 [Russula compacta]
MPPIVSQLLKFSVARGFKLDSPGFAQLRTVVVANGVKEQYMSTLSPLPKEWPADKGPLKSPEFTEAVRALDVKGKPDSYYLPFAHDSLPRPALIAPVCELCFLHIKSTADKKGLGDSLNKTFTDCYYADGFTGGHWGAASNDDNMNYYYLGWESRALHRAYSETELFALELNNLMPHTDKSGAYFMKMTQQLN